MTPAGLVERVFYGTMGDEKAAPAGNRGLTEPPYQTGGRLMPHSMASPPGDSRLRR